MARTAKRLTVRTAARQRQAKANEEQRRRTETELDRATDFEIARERRAKAALDIASAETEMGQAITALFALGNQLNRVSELTGETKPEIKRLRKLAESTAASAAFGQRSGLSSINTTPTSA